MKAEYYVLANFVERHGREPAPCTHPDCVEIKRLLAACADRALQGGSRGFDYALPAAKRPPKPQRPQIEDPEPE